MNVLLIYPEFPDTFWNFKHALRFIRKRATYPPLGLLTVAALLPEEWGKRLADLNVRKLTDEDLEWADMAFISSMLLQEKPARRIITRCKEAGLKVVAGGPLFTNAHERFEDVDHFVLNEAEVTLAPFLADLEKGCAQRVYATDEFPDLRWSPVPLWGLADLTRYNSVNIQFSRGCPHQCEFCNVTALFGHRSRTKTSEQILAELNSLRDHGWHGTVFFVDDNFIGNKKVLKTDLLPALIEWQRSVGGMTFHTEVCINLADDDELLHMMGEAGFYMVFIGIETPNDDSLAECNKKQNRNRNLIEDVKRIRRAGLEVQGGFIVGFDNDTPSIFQRQIEFIQKSGIVTAMVGLLQAMPGTRLHERLEKEGRLNKLTSGDNVDGTTNIIPTMNVDTLRRGYRRMLKRIYSPDNYYRRIKTFLWEYKPPKIRTRLRPQDVMAFFRSVLRLGILGKERFHYWKLLVWTSLRRRRLFPTAITLAIYGQHFRKIAERNTT